MGSSHLSLTAARVHGRWRPRGVRLRPWFPRHQPPPNSRVDSETGPRTGSEGELADRFREFGFGIHPGDLFARDRVAWPSKVLQDARTEPPDARIIRLPRHEPIQQVQRMVQISDDLIPGRDGEERVGVPRILPEATVRVQHDLLVRGRRYDLNVLTDRVLLLQLVGLHGPHRRSGRRERGSSKNAGRLIGSLRRDSGIVFGGSTKWTRSAPTRRRCERALGASAASGASIIVMVSETSGIEPSFTAMRVRIWSSARLTLIDWSADRYRRAALHSSAVGLPAKREAQGTRACATIDSIGPSTSRNGGSVQSRSSLRHKWTGKFPAPQDPGVSVRASGGPRRRYGCFRSRHFD